MLWLCIQLPWLVLEVFERGNAGSAPFGVLEGKRIARVNAPARQAGVRAGMTPAQARVLVPRLALRERDKMAERRALQRCADWAQALSPAVSLEPPAALLLEIAGSVRYFGGLASLRERAARGLAELGYRHCLGIAPTPSAALWLARAGQCAPVTDPRHLRAGIALLPLHALALEPFQAEALRGLGVETVGDCLALPRQGLARRLGADLLHQFDRALGAEPEPRRFWRPPPGYRGELEMPVEVTHAEQVLFGLNRLVRELCGYLQGVQGGVQRLRVRLRHRGRAPTIFTVGLVEPSRAAEHLLMLVRQRLERTALVAPVTAVELSSGDIRTLEPEHGSLLRAPSDTELLDWTALVERLGSRLGEDRVQGLRIRAEHRPERAWRSAAPGESCDGECAPGPERPLWLLPEPCPLPVREERPAWHGPLEFQQGPERIETGWWDGGDVARDYYIATNPGGERVWIFRERCGRRRWFLQGIFA